MKIIKTLLAVMIAAILCQAADSLKVYSAQADTLLNLSGVLNHYTPPSNIKTIWLAGKGMKSDTVPVNCHNIIGPIPLTNGSGKPLYAGFVLYSNALAGTTPVGEVRWQTTPTAAISDTNTAGWQIVDTLGTTGVVDYHVIDSTKINNYAWFDLHNYDATATIFKVRAIFKSAETFIVDLKK